MILSVLYVRFRDIQPIWDITAQILFYAAPIIYPIFDYNHSVIHYYNAAGQPCPPNHSDRPLHEQLHASHGRADRNEQPDRGADRPGPPRNGRRPESVNPSAAFALGGGSRC